MGNSGITTEPDSEIQIADVTTLETGVSSVSDGQLESTDGQDMNLMITHVTSLQNTNLGEVANGLQSSNFGVNIQTFTPSLTSQTKAAVGPFNPGRMNGAGDVFQNGESATHHNPDSWISQSASFPGTRSSQGWILYLQWPHFLNRFSSLLPSSNPLNQLKSLVQTAKNLCRRDRQLINEKDQLTSSVLPAASPPSRTSLLQRNFVLCVKKI